MGRVDVPKAAKLKKELVAKKQKRAVTVRMLPMFNGADVIFRNVLVPLAGQREALLLKDAKMLARTMVKQLPASRHGEAGEAIAEAFLVEAKMQK